MGITQNTLMAWRREPVTEEDVKNLTYREAEAIYIQDYWERPKLHLLKMHPELIELIFDSAVHHGSVMAVRFLQRAAGVKPDALIGPVTLAACLALEQEDLMARVLAERIIFFGYLVEKDPTQSVFIEGWLTRMKEFILALPSLDDVE